MAMGMGMRAHVSLRTVPGVGGPKVFETGLLRRSGGRRLGVLAWHVGCMKRGAKGTVVFTPGEKGPVSRVHGKRNRERRTVFCRHIGLHTPRSRLGTLLGRHSPWRRLDGTSY